MAERVFVAAEDVANAQIFALKHPRTGVTAQFARTASRLLEVHRFAEPSTEPRSWLLAGGQDRVLQDGGLFLATPVDPLFVLLPQLLKARGTTDGGERRGYFQPLSDLIDGEDTIAIQEHVCTLPRLVQQLRAVCDVKRVPRQVEPSRACCVARPPAPFPLRTRQRAAHRTSLPLPLWRAATSTMSRCSAITTRRFWPGCVAR